MGVREVSGPGPSPEGPDAKKKKGVDSDSFREIMRVGKAREVDPEEKRKRKSKQEATEEAKAAMAQGAAPAAPELKEEVPSDEFQLKIKGTAGPSLKGAAGAPPPSEAPEEEEAQEAPPSYPAATPPTPPSWEQPPETTAPTHKEKKEKKRAAPTEAQPLAKKAKKLAKKPLAAPIKIAQEKKIPLELKVEETKPPLPSEKKEAFFEQLAKPKQEPKKEEVLLEGIAPPPLPQGSWEAVQEKTKKEETKKIEPTAAGLQPSLGLPAPPQEITAPVPLTAPYLHLSTAMLDLFDRMVGVLTVMDSSGIKETTIHLTAPQYATSVFFGAEIVLTEYSTAPKTFNIELKGSPQAMALFQGNANELAAAFQGGNYSFRINRIETSLLPTLRVRRKERVTKIKKSKE